MESKTKRSATGGASVGLARLMNASPSPSLSVCTFTNDPPRLVAAALQRVRPIAAEIIVAVDDRVPVEELWPLKDVADRVIRAEFEAPLERSLRWLHEQCGGDWILRLDGDQVVSQALVDELAGDEWHRDITHALIQTDWVWADGTSVLDQHPWSPDPGLRLTRNLPGLVRFPTRVHAPVEVGGAHRILSSSIYELGLALTSVEERSAKADGYFRMGGAVRTDQGLVVNSTYYLPERLIPPPTSRLVTAADRSVVSELVALGRAEAERPSRQPSSDAEYEQVTIADRRPGRPGPDDANVTLMGSEPLRWIAERARSLFVRVENTGTALWRSDDDPPIRLGVRMYDAAGEVVGIEQSADLPCTVRPGATELVRISTIPPPPGGWLVFGMVREDAAWFGEHRVDVDQTPPRRVVISSGISPYSQLGDDLIVRGVLRTIYRQFPDMEPMLLVDVPGDVGHRFNVRTVASGGAVIHRKGRAGRILAARRALAFLADARRHRAGRVLRDPLHQDLLDAMAGADALVLAGALTSSSATEGQVTKALEVMAAKVLGTPVLVEAGSVGPLHHLADRLAIRRLAQVAGTMSVRDPRSREVLLTLGVAPEAVEVVPDVATSLVGNVASPIAPVLASVGVDPDRPYAVLSLRDGLDGPNIGPAIDAALRALPGDLPVLLVPHGESESTDDRRVLRRLTAADRVTPLAGLDADEAVAVIIGARLALGTRFHQAVLAGAAGVPAIALVSSDDDRHRISGLESTGLVVVDTDATLAEITATVDQVLQAPAPAPTERWSDDRFARLLGDLVPPPPTLP